MIPDQKRFQRAIRLFDAANEADPNLEEWQGETLSKELLYARRMSERLRRFATDPSEALQLAARCQHIRRWEIPRDDYPMTRQGYLQWRNDLKEFHADKAAEILQEAGYDAGTIDRVRFLVLKKQLKRDEETQLLEDVVCLVFLEHYFDPFAGKHDDEKLVDILRKTWRKMSEKGRAAALELPLTRHAKGLLHKALQGDD